MLQAKEFCKSLFVHNGISREKYQNFNTVNLPALTEISTPFELSYLWAMYMLLMSLGFFL